MFDYLRENPGIKLLVNLIFGIIIFKFLFSLVFGGPSYGGVQGLLVLIIQLAKVLLVLGLVAGSMVITNKLLSGKDLTKLDLNPQQIFKGVVLVILGVAAFYLLNSLLGATTGSNYYMGGHGVVYGGNLNSFNLEGIFTGILSLVMNLLIIALVMFLILGGVQAARPYLEKEFQGLFTATKSEVPLQETTLEPTPEPIPEPIVATEEQEEAITENVEKSDSAPRRKSNRKKAEDVQ